MEIERKSPFEVLGLHEGASDKEIKEAFRSRSKECHPDLHKGKEEEMKALTESYTSLTKYRRYYDEFGLMVSNDRPFFRQAEKYIEDHGMIIAGNATLEDLPGLDLISMIEVKLEELKSTNEEVLRNIPIALEKLEVVEKRMKVKKGKNIFLERLQIEKGYCYQKEKQMKFELEILDESLKILEDYTYEFDEVEFSDMSEEELRQKFNIPDHINIPKNFKGEIYDN